MNEEEYNELCRLTLYGLTALLAMMFAVCMSSCQSVKYIPVETTRTDSIYNTIYQRDSIYVRDSVYIIERGDTVYQYRYKYMFVDKMKHDTIYIERVDSIRIPYPVEKELSRWEKIKVELGGWAFGILIASVSFIVIWITYKRKHK